MSLRPKTKKPTKRGRKKQTHTALIPCSCSKKNNRVIAYYRANWKNGTTDVQVRKLSRGYRVIEHCCEHITRDGTGISEIIYNEPDAKALAKWYAAHLRKQK